jgi:hypothetical protein
MERLEAILVELDRLPLPPGRAGSSLLDAAAAIVLAATAKFATQSDAS